MINPHDITMPIFIQTAPRNKPGSLQYSRTKRLVLHKSHAWETTGFTAPVFRVVPRARIVQMCQKRYAVHLLCQHKSCVHNIGTLGCFRESRFLWYHTFFMRRLLYDWNDLNKPRMLCHTCRSIARERQGQEQPSALGSPKRPMEIAQLPLGHPRPRTGRWHASLLALNRKRP